MPRYAASRALPARVEDVWTLVADPGRFPDWWPGVARVDPGRRGLVPGARWRLESPSRPRHLGRAGATGPLLVLEVVPLRHVAFQLTGDRVDVVLELEPAGDDRTHATLVVDMAWLIGAGRRFPHRVLERLQRAL